MGVIYTQHWMCCTHACLGSSRLILLLLVKCATAAGGVYSFSGTSCALPYTLGAGTGVSMGLECAFFQAWGCYVALHCTVLLYACNPSEGSVTLPFAGGRGCVMLRMQPWGCGPERGPVQCVLVCCHALGLMNSTWGTPDACTLYPSLTASNEAAAVCPMLRS